MIKNKLTRLLALTAVSTALISGASVAEDVTASASVTVQNSFDLVETTPLTFGTLAAISGTTDGDVASISILANGAAGDISNVDGTASITVITAGTPGVFTVSNAAPNTDLTIGGLADFLLTDPSSTDGKNFAVTALTTSVVTSGTAFTFDTDDTGTMVFNVGATLSTEDSATTVGTAGAYEDVTFTGSYTVTVNY